MTKNAAPYVLETLAGPVAQLTLNRPHVKNALNGDMVSYLIAAFQRLGQAPDVRVIILAAQGDAFCSGLDLAYMQQTSRPPLSALFRGIAECPKPVVARVSGLCFAGGMGLACASDILIASSNATFCLPEVKVGLIPATISPYVIQAMGAQAARRYFLTAEVFTAQTAHHLGMVHELCEVDQLNDVLEGLLRHVLRNGPNAMAACKQLLQSVGGMPIGCDNTHEFTAQCLERVRTSAEAVEGMQAFLEKRKPSWLF